MWDREAEYREDLELVIQKAATTRLERLASLAVEDERTCYKHVVVLLEKQYRKCGANMRGKLHLLYCISALLRHSRKQQGQRDRYAERLKPLVAALVLETRPEFSAQIDKLLKLWRMETVFTAEQLAEVESGRAAAALRAPGLQSKSPSGSLTEASAQDQHMGFGDASGSGRSSVIQSNPRMGGGRAQPYAGGSMQPFQQPTSTESQDPYSADSNPNGARAPPPPPPPPPPLPPPPPPPLIPPGLLGPPPGLMTAQTAAAAAAGLFPQTQLGGFLAASPAALIQGAPFMGPMGPFTAGICTAMPAAMGAGMPAGVGVAMGSVLPGPGMPFQAPAGPMPPGLGLQCAPMYPPQPIYNNNSSQGQGPQGQGHGQGQGTRGGHYNRFNNSHGRPGATMNQSHVQGQGWQGRGCQEGSNGPPAGLPPGLVPRPAPPQGSPPRADGQAIAATAAATATAANNSAAAVPVGAAGASGGASSSSGGASAAGKEPAYVIRPGGRRSRWELERDCSDSVPPAAPIESPTPAGEPQPKRPAWAFQGSRASREPPAAAMPPPPPPPPPATHLPPPPTADLTAGEKHSAGQVEAAAAISVAVELAGPAENTAGPQDSQPPEPPVMAVTCPEAEKARGKPEAAAPAVDRRESLNPLGLAGDTVAAIEPTEDVSCPGAAACKAGGDVASSAVCSADVDVAGPADSGPAAVAEAEAGAGAMEVDDGGSSSAEVVWSATHQQYSTAPSSPGRASGPAEQEEPGQSGLAEQEEPGQSGLAEQEEPGQSGPAEQEEPGQSGAGAECGDEQERQGVQDEQERRAAGQTGGDGQEVEHCPGHAVDRPVTVVADGEVAAGALSDGAGEPGAGLERPAEEPTAEGQQGGEVCEGTAAEPPQEQQALEDMGDAQQPQVLPEPSSGEEAVVGQEAAQQPVCEESAAMEEDARAGVVEVEGGQGGAQAPSAAAEAAAAAAAAAAAVGEAGEGSCAAAPCGSGVGAGSEGASPGSEGEAEGGEGAGLAPEAAAVPTGALEASAEQGAAESSASGDPAQPDAAAAAGQAAEAELDSAAATSPAVPLSTPLAETDSTVVVTSTTAVSGKLLHSQVVPDTAQPQQPARPSEPGIAAEAPPPAPEPTPLQSSGLILSSYDDSRVPLKLEELELGELDDTWL